MGVNVVKLGDYVKIQTGKLDANASDDNGLYPFFTCAIEPLRINKFAYDCECILIAGNGDLNVKYYNGKFNAYQRTYIVEVVKEELNIRYLYHFLSKYIDILRNKSIGGVIKYIKLGDLTGIKLPLPSKEQQEKIVTILDKADEIRTKKKQANDKLDEFLKSKFIELFGKNIEQYKLEDLCFFITKGTTPPAKDMSQDCGDIPYIKVYNLRFDTRLDFTINPTYVTKEAHNNFLSRSIVYPNDVLMNIVGPPLGKVSIVPNTYSEWNINQAIARFRCKKNLNNLYLAWFLTTPFAMKQMLRNAKKTSGQLNLTLEICKNIEIPIPPIEEQNKFAEIVEKVEEQKQKNEKVIEQMDNLFNSLSQQAFKGELESNVIDLLTKQSILHSKIIDKCYNHNTFGSVKLEKIFNICDMVLKLNLAPDGYYRKAAGPYIPKMRHSVEDQLTQKHWVKITNNDKKVEFKKDTKFSEYREIYSKVFNNENESIEQIINYFYEKNTDYCEAFSTLYMCWNDLIIEGKKPNRSEIIDEFKNHWAIEKQRFDKTYLLEVLSDIENNFEPQGQGLHTIDSDYNKDENQLSLPLE